MLATFEQSALLTAFCGLMWVLLAPASLVAALVSVSMCPFKRTARQSFRLGRIGFWTGLIAILAATLGTVLSAGFPKDPPEKIEDSIILILVTAIFPALAFFGMRFSRLKLPVEEPAAKKVGNPIDLRIFDWLGNDSQNVPYYLHSLNMVWSREGVEYDLKVYQRVAQLLSEQPEYWAELIRDVNWRETLAGCTCLLAVNKREFYDDLCFRFREGSFVAPQIAVTLGLLHPERARSFFKEMLASPGRFGPKQVVSAHRVLLKLGVQPTPDPSEIEWSVNERDDAIVAANVVEAHWNFWSRRIGI